MSEGKAISETGWKLENSYAQLPKMFYSKLELDPVSAPKMVVFNEPLAASIGLGAQALQSGEGIAVLAGNRIPEGSLPIAQAYAGHQFGHFTMLGDGRALLVGEQITPVGARFDIQLKGSGRTPYSRGGDGRASLGPMLREYIISEAMHALGIATTRSLAVVTTGEPVFRQTQEIGAIMTRVAASHLRIGTFEYAARYGSTDELAALADYAIARHFPEIEAEEGRYLYLLKEVIKKQAALIAQWQMVGFIHGVMNTDNMTISGETIDYGPCAYMNEYDPATVFSSIDSRGRYAYGSQPSIAGWNFTRFAETLLPLLHENEEQAVKMAQAEVSKYNALFHRNWLGGMRAKLGIINEEEQDENLIEALLSLMKTHRADFTNTFRALTFDTLEDTPLFCSAAFIKWRARWQQRLDSQRDKKAESQLLMRISNPGVIPRNHRVEEALEAAVEHGDYSVMERLLEVLSKPYAHSPEQEAFAAPPEASTTPYRTYCGT